MALETHNYYYTGEYITTKLSYSGSITSTTSNDGPKLRDKVNVISYHGNFSAPTPFALQCLKVSGPRGYSHYDAVDILNGKKSYIHLDGYVGFREVSYSIPSNQSYNKALSRFNEKVRGSIDLTVETAQASQTIRMIKGCAAAERYATSRDWRSWIGKSSERWLEYQYGYKPLLQTIFSATDELLGYTKNLTKTVSDTATDRWKIIPTAQFPFYGTIVASGPLSGSSRTRICCILSDVSGRDTPRWLSYDPSTVIWESIPYSFVVDWFYNVSGFLRDQETAYLYNKRFVSGYVSSGHKVSGRLRFLGQRTQLSGRTRYTYSVNAQSRLDDSSTSRTVLGSYPSPTVPHFEVSLGWQRLLSAAALIGVHTPPPPGKSGGRRR